MNCPRCGTPMQGGICPNCGFPVNRLRYSKKRIVGAGVKAFVSISVK